MKNTIAIALALAATTLASSAAVSLTFSAVTGAANGVLTNLASSTGDATSQRVWGILVDSGNNGVSLGGYLPGASLALGATTTLETSGGPTDDVLYIANSLMINTANATIDGGTVTNLARPTSFLNIPTPGGTSLADPFYLIWFDATAAGGTAGAGSKYGAFRIASFELPADGASVSFASNFVGVEPLRTADLTFVPEPSAALLGAIGALGLLRRRRI
jgi:hypothetical protein